MELLMTADCPECGKVNLVSIITNQAKMTFYDDCEDEVKIFAPSTYSLNSIVANCENCDVDFVVDVELESHVKTRSIA
jgi:transcription elongation factor Elf1